MSLHSSEIIQKDPAIQLIAQKIFSSGRITSDEALLLYEQADLGTLGILANYVREAKNGSYAYYNRNFHIEPTNICQYQCLFCSYSRKEGQEGAWEYSIGEMTRMALEQAKKGITEIHIVGGVHPRRDVSYYAQLIASIREACPSVHIKAFSAVELAPMFHKAGLSIHDGLNQLRLAGLGSIPGGGAEIFDATVRATICPDKSDAQEWLEVHKTAHQMGISSNATMLYGHIETYRHRIDHMDQLRQLQDVTQGFNAFIPLKYRSSNNKMSQLGEGSPVEDLKNYALSRIYLDNIPHIKAYWPMIGKQMAQLSLWFGADDIDGTIEDSTKIYSLAGADDQSPTATSDELIDMIQRAGRIPVERNSLYQPV